MKILEDIEIYLLDANTQNFLKNIDFNQFKTLVVNSFNGNHVGIIWYFRKNGNKIQPYSNAVLINDIEGLQKTFNIRNEENFLCWIFHDIKTENERFVK